jgi:hypothetical protein
MRGGSRGNVDEIGMYLFDEGVKIRAVMLNIEFSRPFLGAVDI